MQLELKIKSLPNSAGVYQYFDKDGKLLYVGKAKNLSNRVKSYFRFNPEFRINNKLSSRIIKMLSETIRLEYIIVDSEDDALILENSLIKQLKPKYNILLRDDKTYPYIYINELDEFPRFELTRKVIKSKGVKYYGPFPNGGRELLNAIYEIYPLVQKSSCLKGKKACLFYQIKKCLAPCEGRVSRDEYIKIVDSAKKDIENRANLILKLKDLMLSFASNEQFEEAMKKRDMIESIKKITLSSQIDLASSANYDIFVILNGDDRGVVVRLFMRGGKIISSSYSYFRETHIYNKSSAYKQVLLEFYSSDMPSITTDILVGDDFEDIAEIESILSDKLAQKVSIKYPKIGSRAKLINIALQNAKELLKVDNRNSDTEQDIAHLLNLSRVPFRVEAFDNSHISGESIVGGMVVWNEGEWDKSSYRRYRLNSRDEYGQMREMLLRRIESGNLPDLWILDGGLANLNLAFDILKERDINLDVIAIAKEKINAKANRAKGRAKDKIYTKDNIFNLTPSDKRLQWIQRSRDESHRYAISYHRKLKRENDKKISLLSKKGIGEATIKKLINFFGTFEEIEKSSFEDIKDVTNIKIAKILKDN